MNFIENRTKNKYERKYVNHFYKKIKNEKFYYVFCGSRRIGKTTMCFQIINKLFSFKFILNKELEIEEIYFYILSENISFELKLENIEFDNLYLRLSFLSHGKFKEFKYRWFICFLF